MGGEASDLLVEARGRAKLTQTELARRAGVTQPVLSAYEHGRRQPSAAALLKLLEAAGFKVQLAPGPRRIDEELAGKRLVEVIRLAEMLPFRRDGPLEYPPLRRR